MNLNETKCVIRIEIMHNENMYKAFSRVRSYVKNLLESGQT